MTGKQQLDDLEAVRKVIEALAAFEPADQERILRWAREKVGLAPAMASGVPAVIPPVMQPAEDHGNGPKPTMDIKTFIDLKKPTSDSQFAAAVAYFYRFVAPAQLRKDSITKDDLLEACRQVNRPRFPRPAQTLVNAHGQGLLDRGERGAYSINTVGENLVDVALPSDGSRATVKRKTGSRSGKKPTGSRSKPKHAKPKTSSARAGNKKRGR